MKSFYNIVFNATPYALLWVWAMLLAPETSLGAYLLLAALLVYTDLMNYYQGHRRGFTAASDAGAMLLMDVIIKLKPTREQMKRIEGITGDGDTKLEVKDVTDEKLD